ncbi:MAG TPA: GGDEF domain-containing protein, partial [Actinomycetota bacterium]|nr:GGDEF domain-containing protein [Actinomycetota bacterium]
NPLTQLPGNTQIDLELRRRVDSNEPFALMHIDIDNFKAYNDLYGFLRGDQAIRLLARCAGEATGASPSGDGFLGHVGGDDFVAMVPPGDAEEVAQDIIDTWDRNVASLYDPADVERGYIEVPDRRHRLHRYPLSTLSIGIATNVHRTIESHWHASQVASEMRAFAKNSDRSSYEIDRRSTDRGPSPE